MIATVVGVILSFVGVLLLVLNPANRQRISAFLVYRGFFFWGVRGYARRQFGRGSSWETHSEVHSRSAIELKILKEFMQTYKREDCNQISRGYVTTNFEAYSGFVQGAVDRIGKERRGNEIVYLVTCLALPVAQWFNYGRTPPRVLRGLKTKVKSSPLSHFAYAMKRWDDYTEFLRNFLKTHKEKGDTSHIRMYRYVVCFDESVVREAKRGAIKQPLELVRERSRENTILQLKSWILCDANGVPEAITPASLTGIVPASHWVEENQNAWFQFYQLEENRQRECHIIAPSDALALGSSGMPDDPCGYYRWHRIKDAFSRLYQDSDRHLFMSTLDAQAVTRRYEVDREAIPQDFFLIGIKDKNIPLEELFSTSTTVDWLYCLSAVDPDEKLDKLELHFIGQKGLGHPKVAPLGNIIGFLRDEINVKRDSNKNRPSLGYDVVVDL